MSAVAPSRLAALRQLQCAVFQTSYNPTSVRTGAKYLRARLRGPSMVKYYPKQVSIAQLMRQGLDLVNQEEEQRLQDAADRKARGKGAPPKAKEKGASSFVPLARVGGGGLLTVLCVFRRQSQDEQEAVMRPLAMLYVSLLWYCAIDLIMHCQPCIHKLNMTVRQPSYLWHVQHLPSHSRLITLQVTPCHRA
jgi:small subunit ribosomal protein S33